MKISTILHILLIILNSFIFIESQVDEEISMRVLSCMNVINHKGKEKEGVEPSVYSPEMLSCFMKISNEQTDRILSNFESGVIPLDDEEIDELTDAESLRDYSSEEIKKKSDELENAIKEFKKFDEDFNKLKEQKENGDSDNGDDNNNQDNNEKKGGWFGWLFKIINDWLDDNKSLFIGMVIVVMVCILTAIFGKPYEEDIENGKKVPPKNKSE